jgi:hypothetical protein
MVLATSIVSPCALLLSGILVSSGVFLTSVGSASLGVLLGGWGMRHEKSAAGRSVAKMGIAISVACMVAQALTVGVLVLFSSRGH